MEIILKKNETMKDVIGRLIASADMVYGIAPIAYWYENLHENGRIKDIHFSDQLRKLLGYKSARSFPNKLDTLLRKIHPDDVDMVLENAIAAGTGKIDRFDVQYRIRKADGEYLWVNATGQLVKDSEGRTVGMYGAFIDITAQIEASAVQKDLAEKAQQRRNEIIAKMAGDDGLFIIDCVRDTRRTVHDRCYGAANYSDDEKYTTAVGRYIDKFVSKADKKMMREATSPRYMLERATKEGEYSVEYRENTTGVQRFYGMKIVRLSDTEVLQSFSDIEKEYVDRLLLQVLKDDYFGLYRIDLDAGLVQALKRLPWYDAGEVKDITAYQPAVRKFAQSFTGEERAYFEKISDIEYLKQRFAQEDKSSYIFKMEQPDGDKWVNVLMQVGRRHKDGTPSLLIVGCSILDTDARERRELLDKVQKALSETEEANKLISEWSAFAQFFLKQYQSVYYIGLDDRSFKPLQREADLEANYPVGPSYVVSLGNFVKNEVHPEDWEKFTVLLKPRQLKKILAEKPDFSFNYRRISGGVERIVQARVLRGSDKAHACFGFRDITEEVSLQLEQQRQLEEALSLAESANRAKSVFLFNMSHDIRTPMNAILGYTDVALRHFDDRARVKDGLKKIKHSGEHLLSLINDILEMSRIESGKMEITESPLDIRQGIESVKQMSEPLAIPKSIEFKVITGEIKNPYIYADQLHFNEVLINIISNAMKYSNDGGKVRYTVSQLSEPADGMAWYRFVVADKGIGMSEDFLKHIFESFSREKSSTVSKQEGAGLGMAIVKRIVDMTGGTIDIKSKPGKGTTITVDVPFRVMDEEAVKEFLAEHDEDKKLDTDIILSGKRVMLVEDNEMNREIAEEILKDSGLETETAEDGDLAVKLFRKQGSGYYDFILMDIQMPVMDGYEATGAIRELPGGDTVPIIALSANAFAEDKMKSFEAGMNDHIAKPIDIKELFETLQKWSNQ